MIHGWHTFWGVYTLLAASFFGRYNERDRLKNTDCTFGWALFMLIATFIMGALFPITELISLGIAIGADDGKKGKK